MGCWLTGHCQVFVHSRWTPKYGPVLYQAILTTQSRFIRLAVDVVYKINKKFNPLPAIWMIELFESKPVLSHGMFEAASLRVWPFVPLAGLFSSRQRNYHLLFRREGELKTGLMCGQACKSSKIMRHEQTWTWLVLPTSPWVYGGEFLHHSYFSFTAFNVEAGTEI